MVPYSSIIYFAQQGLLYDTDLFFTPTCGALFVMHPLTSSCAHFSHYMIKNISVMTVSNLLTKHLILYSSFLIFFFLLNNFRLKQSTYKSGPLVKN